MAIGADPSLSHLDNASSARLVANEQDTSSVSLIKAEDRSPDQLRHRGRILADGVSDSGRDIPSPLVRPFRISKRQIISVGVLCFVNLINYMDRYTLAGVLDDVKENFDIDNDEGGLLQTVFVLSYMIFAPIFGFLGDRYSRRWVMAFGVFLWAMTTLLGSFMTNFTWFLFFRAMVGIGEASYSTIAPTIISDLFVSDLRSKMLALFYFAIPVGSGLGYIVGSQVALALGHWAWALRVTPILAGVALPLIVCVLEDPVRGEAEGGTSLHATSYWQDIRALCFNRSFLFSTLGFTAVAFVAGALAWWGPNFMKLGMAVQGYSEKDQENVSFIFGLITMVSGIIGVPMGSFIAQRLRHRYPKSDPIVCAVGLLLSAPLLLAASFVASTSTVLSFVLIFFGELALNMNWAIVADILLYVVIPTRRSTAEAFQILISHMFGDAGSPYLIGIISDQLKPKFMPKVLTAAVGTAALVANSTLLMDMNADVEGFNTTVHPEVLKKPEPTPTPEEAMAEFEALKYSLMLCVLVEFLGGLFFIINGWFIEEDRRVCEELTHQGQTEGERIDPSPLSSSPDHSYGGDLVSDETERNVTLL
ncbi:unnamed protein product [Cyprideis torosa]|uniref:Uncharacterized protein n=1 Tax=Cyprideis torosa TaxID=163714 RepID=A0A7R8WAG6_9CRUS|nr:unnamed protein product [Cyprideis torosa]CAG0885459.1 unnamed protein product [Cyprideis torosa]